MSEYQYYEFQAVDRPLTQEQMGELRVYSSRARITPSSFVNEYNWGDFKGDPDKWMEKYFDAFLYLANWGSRWLMLRVPKTLLDPDTALAYCTGEKLSCRAKGDYIILSFDSEEEEYEWSEGEGWLASLIPLRADVMRGDHRCLYLGWLLGVQSGELDDVTLEPPVPPGLGDLNAPLGSFADFLRIDHDLISAAAEQSAKGADFGLSDDDIAKWVADLSLKDKGAFLMKMIGGDYPHAAAELRQRALSEIHGAREAGGDLRKSERRSVGQLIARAEVITEERRKREAERAALEKARREQEQAKNRKQYLESLVNKESGLWAKVDKLIATKQPKRYDEAISLLQDLHDLAEFKGKNTEFSLRMSTLHSEHMRKPALVNKFRKAKLLS
ncbi:MAG: hypothetical protein ACE5JX_19340 [Acidobacteriota bacterium]